MTAQQRKELGEIVSWTWMESPTKTVVGPAELEKRLIPWIERHIAEAKHAVAEAILEAVKSAALGVAKSCCCQGYKTRGFCECFGYSSFEDFAQKIEGLSPYSAVWLKAHDAQVRLDECRLWHNASPTHGSNCQSCKRIKALELESHAK